MLLLLLVPPARHPALADLLFLFGLCCCSKSTLMRWMSAAANIYNHTITNTPTTYLRHPCIQPPQIPPPLLPFPPPPTEARLL